jgi:Tfp pilus assembly protein PilN
MPDYLFVAPYKNGFEGGLISRGGLVQTFQGNFKGRKKEEAIATEILPIMIALTEEKRSFDILLLHHNDFDLDLGPVLSHPVKNIKPLQNRDVQSFSAYAAAGSMIGSLQGRGSNLLSRGARPQRSISLALTSCLLLLGMVTAGLYYFIPLDHKTQKVVEIERQIKLRETEVKKVQKLKKEADSLQAEMDAVQGFRSHKPMMINIFKDLTTRVPQTAWLTTVKVTEKDMYMGGYAADAAALLPKMGTIGPFQKAEFASPVTRDSRTNTYNFSIKMESKDGGNAKKNDPKK